MHERVAILWIAFIGFGMYAGPVEAQDSWGYDIAHELMSPYCPGRTLATCPSPQAAELVQWIVMQEAAGATREQVVEMLIERFGEDILGAPKAEGVTLWAYVLPVLAFGLGGGVAFFVLRRIVGARKEGTAGAAILAAGAGGVAASDLGAVPGQDLDDDDLARIVDADLELRA